MRKAAFILVFLNLILLPLLTQAKGSLADNVTVVSLPFSNDLYVAGGSVVVTQPVDGDLLAAGGSLVVNVPVGADLQAAGGSIIVNNRVGDDLRAVGGDVTLASAVGGDVVIYGGSVTIPAGVIVEGDAIIGSGTLYLAGTVRGDLRVNAETVDFSGSVLGDAQFYGYERINMNGRVDGRAVFAAPDVALGPNAGFGGDVYYWRRDGEMDFGQTPATGAKLFSAELERKGHRAGTGKRMEQIPRRGIAAVFSLFFLGTLMSGFLAVALGTLLFKRTLREAGEVLHLTFWKGFGVGILTYFLLPVAAVVVMFTLVGIPIGLLLLALFVFSLVFGRVITAMVFAAWVERRRAAQWGSGRLMFAAMGFFVLLKLATLVPILGWVVVLLTTLAGYGALVVALLESRSSAF